MTDTIKQASRTWHRLGLPRYDDRDPEHRLVFALLREQRAASTRRVAEMTHVDPEAAETALPTMADGDYWPIVRRGDLGPDIYEAIEHSALERSDGGWR